MGRIVSGKGADRLVEAIPHFAEEIQVTIAGDGEQLPFIKKRVQKLKLGRRVHFTGWVSAEKKQTLLEQADIFCLPSSLDSFGMVFIEAMANGVPVVALDWGPIADVVPHGKAGLVVENDAPNVIAQAVNRLAADKQLRNIMGEAGKAWVLEQYGSAQVGQRLKLIFESL
jgi:glycosyltransferase involved in cell wall biosynthesis